MTWYPIGRNKRKGRQKTTWMDGIRRMMRELGITQGDWRNRKLSTKYNWNNLSGHTEAWERWMNEFNLLQINAIAQIKSNKYSVIKVSRNPFTIFKLM